MHGNETAEVRLVANHLTLGSVLNLWVWFCCVRQCVRKIMGVMSEQFMKS
jgi:hypothetical protein